MCEEEGGGVEQRQAKELSDGKLIVVHLTMHIIHPDYWQIFIL